MTYATKHGATAEIAQAIGEELQEMGFDTEVHPVKEAYDVGSFDAVILGSAIYNRKWLREAMRFGKRHAAELREKPVWLFGSGPIGTAATRKSFEGSESPSDLERRFWAQESVMFSGRLRPGDVGWLARRRARKAAGPGNMFGDWRNLEGVRMWARDIGTGLQEARAASPKGESLLVGFRELVRRSLPPLRVPKASPAGGERAVPDPRPRAPAPSRVGTGSPAGRETVLTDRDMDPSVDLRTGESLVVRLMETPETGFRWAIDTVDPAVLYLRRDDLVKDPDPNVIEGTLRHFEFIASRPGKCKLVLKLWDESIGEESIEEQYTVAVRIR